MSDGNPIEHVTVPNEYADAYQALWNELELINGLLKRQTWLLEQVLGARMIEQATDDNDGNDNA